MWRILVRDRGQELAERFSMEVFVETLLLSLNRISVDDFTERLSLQRSSMEDGVCGEIEFH